MTADRTGWRGSGRASFFAFLRARYRRASLRWLDPFMGHAAYDGRGTVDLLMA